MQKCIPFVIRRPVLHHSGLASVHFWVTVWLSVSEGVSISESVSTESTCLREARSAGCTDWVVDDVSESSDWLVLTRQTHSYWEARIATCCPGP